MKNISRMRCLFCSILVGMFVFYRPIILLGNALDNPPCIDNSEEGGKCDECPKDESDTDTGCAWIKIFTGNMHPGTTIGKGFFSVGEESLSPSSYTPLNLRYVAGYAIKELSKEKTPAGVPRKVYMLDPRGVMLSFGFEDGESIAAPSYSDSKTMLARVLMTDAEGWSTTNDPAYYDLYPGDGDMYRFVASTNSPDYRQLVLHKTSAGREETQSSIDIEIIRDQEGIIRQVMAPSRFCDVVTNSAYKYSINIYRKIDIQAGKDGDGYFVPQSNAVPVEVWTFENPETSTLKYLRVSQIIGNQTNVSDYAYLSDSEEWTLTKGNGLLTESRETAWNDNRTMRTITRTKKDQSGQLFYNAVETVQEFAWGPGVVQAVNDPAGAALTKVYTYTSQGDTASKQNPDGSWVQYNYNSNRYMIAEVKGFKDAGFGATNETVVTYYDYTPVDPSDSFSSSFNDKRPRVVTEVVNGITVAKTYNAYLTNAVKELIYITERCSTAASIYGSADNQRTIRTYYGTNAPAFQIGLLKSVQHPDGRLDCHNYELGNYQSSTNPAECSFSPDPDGAAWRETITHGITNSPDGIANKTTKEIKVLDGYSQEVLDETYVYTGSGYERIAWTVQKFSDFYKPIATYKSDGTMSEATWAACGCKKQSEKDSSGIEKTYDLDLLNRVIAATKKGTNTPTDDIKSQYTYDAADRRLTEILVGGTESGSLSMLVSSNSYDLAGRLVSSVNSLNLTNSYSYQSGGRISIVIQSGGTTNVTENYFDGSIKSVSENGVTRQYYDYGVNIDGTRWTIVYTGPAGINSLMWSKNITDMLGRTIREEKPGFGGGVLTNSYSFNSKSQLVGSQASDQLPTIYQYNDLGEQTRSGIDINNNGTLDLASMDRITETESYFEKTGSGWFKVSVSKFYAQDNSAAVTTNSIQKAQLTGLGTGGLVSFVASSDILGNQTTSSTTIDRGNKKVTQAVSYPDSTNNSSQITINGLLVTSTSKTGIKTDFGYDLLERRISVADPRTGTLITHYNNLGQVDYIEDAASNRTSYVYYPATGRRSTTTDALGNSVFTEYDINGQVVGAWGATYPVAYEYDAFNRMTAMYTYRGTNLFSLYSEIENHKSEMDKTSWLYDLATGLLTNKIYADGNGPAYSYTPDGKLASRTWARTFGGTNLATTYSYANAGELIGVDYSDSTPDVAFTYNRLGQQKTIADGQGARAFTYNDALQLASETNAMGLVTRSYDSLGRNAGFTDNSDYSVNYVFDALGRLAAVTSTVIGVNQRFDYSYLENSDLMSAVSNSVNSIHSIKTYESNRNLITSIQNMSGTTIISQFDYINDQLGRRTQRVDTLAVTNTFGHNLKSELVVASMGTNSYNYWYDNIGNRISVTNNGEAVAYTANNLNQYTSITNGGLKVLSYDMDGNLTNDGVFAYTWDCENRLISVQSVVAGGSPVRLEFAYDYMSRRISKSVYNLQSEIWNLQSQTKFVYDGWNLISEINVPTSGNAVTNYYVWGLDLSGTLQGAGGIGGLLMANLNGVNLWYGYDANGNVTDLLNADGIVAGHYEYGPYGQVISSSGTEAVNNKIRFSTKYWDDEMQLGYWGFRYYHPDQGRWLSRDPIEEIGGWNLYGYCANNPGDYLDVLGLKQECGPWKWTFSTRWVPTGGKRTVSYELGILQLIQLVDPSMISNYVPGMSGVVREIEEEKQRQYKQKCKCPEETKYDWRPTGKKRWVFDKFLGWTTGGGGATA